MRIGVFGGTFDPPHTGHVLVAGDVCEALGLDTVTWIPAARQPLKDDAPLASAADRRQMVELAIRDDPRFTLDTVELDRGGLSFTVDTLEALAKRHPGAELVLLVGADSWASFGQWRSPDRILQLARIAVITRNASRDSGSASGAGAGVGEGGVLKEVSPRSRPLGQHRGDDGGREPVLVNVRRVDVSSTEIRERVRRGLPISGFVSEAVRRYIMDARLYR